MIGRLHGTLLAKAPPQVLLDCHGVGYEVDVPMSTFFQLPATGEAVTLLTHLIVREDAHVLFGFSTAGEREAFRQLIRISGIGPRTALAVLSGLGVDDLIDAVTRQDSARLVKVPGIGKKTAERLLLELKGRLAPDLGGLQGATAAGPGDARGDVQQALVALGYSEREAAAAIKGLAPEIGVSEGIKLALKALSRA